MSTAAIARRYTTGLGGEVGCRRKNRPRPGKDAAGSHSAMRSVVLLQRDREADCKSNLRLRLRRAGDVRPVGADREHRRGLRLHAAEEIARGGGEVGGQRVARRGVLRAKAGGRKRQREENEELVFHPGGRGVVRRGKA